LGISLNFTLQHGVITFYRNDSVIHLYAFVNGVGLITAALRQRILLFLTHHLFGFPQMLLSGTFFPITVFPQWLQDICYFLPLTQFNDAMRKYLKTSPYDTEKLGVLGTWISLFIWFS
jgi:ABC-2 type transport system permease protein